MKYTALALILASQTCNNKPTPIQPIGIGGFPSTGGSYSTGGNDIIEDASIPVEEDASVVAAIEWPQCPKVTAARKALLKEHKLGRRMGQKLRSLFHRPLKVSKTNRSKLWEPTDHNEKPCLDQDNSSACTGFDTENELSTLPFSRTASNKEAFFIYAKATEIDSFAGTWNVDGTGQDTGSDGFSAHSAAIQLKLVDATISSYFSVNDIIVALQDGPGGLGANWSIEMFYPDANCTIHYNRKNIKGGHQWELIGVRMETNEFVGLNSWGQSFGACIKKKCGYFYISFDDVNNLLEDYGQADFFDLAH